MTSFRYREGAGPFSVSPYVGSDARSKIELGDELSNGHALGIITDTPGVWPLHCHIEWHLAQGKMAAIVVQPDAVERISQPSDWSDVSRVRSGRCLEGLMRSSALGRTWVLGVRTRGIGTWRVQWCQGQ